MSIDEANLWTAVRSIESRVADLETHRAVSVADRAHLDRRFDTLEKQIGQTESTIRKIGWFVGALIATSLLGAFMNFVLSGGLVGAS